MTIRELRQELFNIENQDEEIVSIGTYGGSNREYEYVIRTKENNYEVGKIKKERN